MPEEVCTYPCTLHYLCELHGLVPPSSSLCVIKAMTTTPGPVTGNWNRFCLCREESWRPWHHAGGKEGSRYTKHLLKERSWRFAIVCSLLKENYTRLHQFCTRLHFTHQGTLCTWFKQPNKQTRWSRDVNSRPCTKGCFQLTWSFQVEGGVSLGCHQL